MTFVPKDPAFETRVRESFARQKAMHLIGAVLAGVEPGRVEIELPFREDLTQQHGFIHAGIVGTVADSAGGYAAYTLMPAGSSVLSVEYKMNLLAPADGERLVASGQVVRAGHTLTVCDLEVEVIKAGARTLCARGMQTLMCLERRPGGAAPG
ncbi:MAG: PaaI family thioesterase [Candidatus Eisenbacteria bacterium]|uniref:PaaI family thioesterase n=1 Tax=Eiseniibacteriota bacterium TaxID=2212470 RepID=A0A538U4Z2_UNCEI|nr:MAG: PaaI family thioesterase [Candidatus Eisenbacteria bacterium]